MTLTFSIVSDLYEAGIQEDGVPYIAETYYILAEDERGNRWSHNTRFNGCTVSTDYEGFTRFTDTRTNATARAQMLLNRITAAGGQINFDCWSETRPAYGSEAYQEYGAHDDWMEEQMERM